MIVMKFGGTSVKDDEWVNKVLAIAADQIKKAPVLVASAMGKITDRLVEIADFSEKGLLDEAYKVFEGVKEHHIKTANTFLTGDNLAKCVNTIENLLNEFNSIIKGLSLLKECSARSNDMILSFGERLSTTIIYHRAVELGMDCTFLDSRNFIKTDDNFGSAAILEELTYKSIQEQIKPAPGKLFVAQGFIASTEEGITSTLGRGGSDYTAAIIGSALNGEEIQIWTDVDGIMTCDPRLVKKAVPITDVSYQEAAELAFFGAKVLHPSTIQPATSKGIPVFVKNTGNPGFVGTKISPGMIKTGAKAIAFKKEITVINIFSSRMLQAYGFLRKIFEIFEKYKTSVDLIATSEVSVSVTIEDTESLDAIVEELKNVASVDIVQNKSIMSVVGQDIWKDSSLVADIFGTLTDTRIRMISMGASDTNLSFVIPQEKTDEAVKKLHKKLFEN